MPTTKKEKIALGYKEAEKICINFSDKSGNIIDQDGLREAGRKFLTDCAYNSDSLGTYVAWGFIMNVYHFGASLSTWNLVDKSYRDPDALNTILIQEAQLKEKKGLLSSDEAHKIGRFCSEIKGQLEFYPSLLEDEVNLGGHNDAVSNSSEE